MEFERAAAIRDRILQLKRSVGEKLSDVEVRSYQPTGAKRRRGKGRAQVPRPKKRM
jgi:excinuclease ABC subunit B